jgi:DNA polymerase-3 subunit delta
LGRSGKKFGPGAAERLEAMAADAPAFLDSVLEQLVTYAGEKPEITEEMVDTFREDFQSVNVFSLTEAIAAKQPGKALALLLKYMDDNDKDWVGLLGLLHWQIRRLWQVKVLGEQGVSEGEILRRAKVSPKQLPFLMRQVKRFTRDQLEQSLEGLFQLDWKIKSGRAEEQPALEAWVVRTASSIS